MPILLQGPIRGKKSKSGCLLVVDHRRLLAVELFSSFHPDAQYQPEPLGHRAQPSGYLAACQNLQDLTWAWWASSNKLESDGLLTQGLYLDMPSWGFHVFVL
jgi:hypothetical protein